LQKSPPESNSLSAVSRYSVPVFPSSYDAELPIKGDDVCDPHRDLIYHCRQPQLLQSAAEVDAILCPYINRARPHSVCVPSSATPRSCSSSLTESSDVSSRRRSLSMESLGMPRVPSRSYRSLDSIVSELQRVLGCLTNRYPQLVVLATQVDRAADLLKVGNE